jgi:glutamate synthase domain-containing protein 2
MTTPKAEAMAREIAEKYFDRHSKSAVALAKELLPLLSAEKERDELKANRQYETDLVATLTSERDELKALLKEADECGDDYRQSMENVEKLIQDQSIELAVKNLKIAELEERLRAFLAKQGESRGDSNS